MFAFYNQRNIWHKNYDGNSARSLQSQTQEGEEETYNSIRVFSFYDGILNQILWILCSKTKSADLIRPINDISKTLFRSFYDFIK